MNFEHLRTFLAVQRAGSITRAAAGLHLSQSTVTTHIQALEVALETRLFDRKARGVSITLEGSELARDLSRHLDAIEAIVAKRRAGGSLTGTIRLGGPADMLSLKVLPALAGLVEQGLKIEVRTGIAEPLLDALAADSLDAVVATRTAGRLDLAFLPLFDEDFVLVGAPEGPIGPEAIEQRGAEALVDARWVAFDGELPLIRRYFEEVFGVAKAELSPSITVSDLRGVREAVMAGAGISVLPAYVVAEALAQRTLVRLHNPARPPANAITLATRHGPPEPRIAAVVEILKRAAPSWARG